MSLTEARVLEMFADMKYVGTVEEWREVRSLVLCNLKTQAVLKKVAGIMGATDDYDCNARSVLRELRGDPSDYAAWKAKYTGAKV